MSALLKTLAATLVVIAAVMWVVTRFPEPVSPPEAATVLDEPMALPDVDLVEGSGRAFSTADLEGRFSLMFFGFTHCPDVCPLTLQALAQAKRQLERDGETAPQVVFVSVDPARDSPQRVHDYVNAFDPDFLGVTGEPAKLQPLYDALHVSVRKQPLEGEHYNVGHNGTIYVINADAEWIALIGGSTDAATVASDFAKVRAGVPGGARLRPASR